MVSAAPRIGTTSVKLDIRRNPFEFGRARQSPHRDALLNSSPPAQPRRSGDSTPTIVEWPTLIGIAEERDGTRTAILVDAKGELLFALNGSVVGAFRVHLTDADAIELEEVGTGQMHSARVR
jgi:hypothetical protein